MGRFAALGTGLRGCREDTPCAVASVEESAANTQLEWDTPLFETAVAQFELALPYADVSEAVAERLRYPERALMLSVPVKMDDGTRRVFAGYRVQHSSVLGPTKGGIRYDPEVTLGECAALARSEEHTSELQSL